MYSFMLLQIVTNSQLYLFTLPLHLQLRIQSCTHEMMNREQGHLILIDLGFYVVYAGCSNVLWAIILIISWKLSIVIK